MVMGNECGCMIYERRRMIPISEFAKHCNSDSGRPNFHSSLFRHLQECVHHSAESILQSVLAERLASFNGTMSQSLMKLAERLHSKGLVSDAITDEFRSAIAATERERSLRRGMAPQVKQMLVSGAKPRDVAEKLGISASYVRVLEARANRVPRSEHPVISDLTTPLSDLNCFSARTANVLTNCGFDTVLQLVLARKEIQATLLHGRSFAKNFGEKTAREVLDFIDGLGSLADVAEVMLS